MSLITKIALLILLMPAWAWAGGPWVVSISTTAAGTRSNTVVTRPSGATTDDYVILCFKKGDDIAIDGTPTGFTEIYKYGSSTGSDQYWGMWYRKITASEANSADTIKHTGDNDETTAGSILVRGVNTTTPFDTTWVTANHFQFEENENDPQVPSITTKSDSALVITFVGQSHLTTSHTATQPTDHTKQWYLAASIGADEASMASTYLKVSAGSTGVMTWDVSYTGSLAETYKGVIALKWDGTSYPPATRSQVMRTTIIGD